MDFSGRGEKNQLVFLRKKPLGLNRANPDVIYMKNKYYICCNT